MSWRTLMRAGKTTGEKNQEPTKPSTESTKPVERDQESPQKEAFVDIVEVSGGSQNLHVEPLPFQPGDRVTYTIPEPDSHTFRPEWIRHSGTILQVDGFREEVVIRPLDEPGEPWRSIWWGYVKGASDGEA